MADVRDSSWSFKAYTIPRKERRPSEDCQHVLPVNSREAKEIEQSTKRLTWDTNDLVDRAFSISYIKKVDNLALEREYHEKRVSMRDEGRLPKELSQQLAFCVETENCRVRDICRIGLVCDGVDHTLGDGYMGVTVWRCPDLCLRAISWPTSGTAYLMVFKIVKGRVKFVSPKLYPEGDTLEPSPNYDCHVSRNTACSSVTDLTTLMQSTQYYLYEYDDEGLPSKRPRHCLPFAVIALQRSEEMASLFKSPVCLENVANAIKDSKIPVQDTTPFFNEEDGILAWRGLVTCKDKRLGSVSLLAGHKLGINFWKSYLDVSTKILLKQLGALLPGDVKSAWRSPLDYRNYVLSLCTMRVASRQRSETFTSFTRHLANKAKAAGVLCIDPSTTMFLVPSGKLAVRLGFCSVAEPLRMFCIVCRRQSLFPPSVCPLTSPTVSRSVPSSSSTPVWPAGSILRPASLDFNVRHKSKIVVSSPSNSLRHSHPRHITKRSLSFSYIPVRNDSKSLQQTPRSASSSGNIAFQGDIAMDSIMSSNFTNDNVMSTTKEESLKNQSRMPDVDSKGNETNLKEGLPPFSNFITSPAKSLIGRSGNRLDVEHLGSSPDFSTVSCASLDTANTSKPKLAVLNLSRLKTLKRLRNVSANAQNGNSESMFQSNGSTDNESSRTPSNAEFPVQNDSFTREGQDHPKTETEKYQHQDLFPSDFLDDSEYERSHTPTTSTNFFPFCPDSPLVLFPDRERSPFLSDTPVKAVKAEDTKEAVSESPKEDISTNLSKPDGESFEAALGGRTRSEKADSNATTSVERPFNSLGDECHNSSSFCVRNWNFNSSYLNDKAILHSLGKAASREGFLKLQRSTHVETPDFCNIEAFPQSVNLEDVNDLRKRETPLEIRHPHDDNQAIQPMEVDLRCSSNEEATENAFKGTESTKIPQVHDDLHAINADVLESSHLAPYDSSSRQSEYVENAAYGSPALTESLRLHRTVNEHMPKAFSSFLNPTGGVDCSSKLMITSTPEKPSSYTIVHGSPSQKVTGNENDKATEKQCCVFATALGQLCTTVACGNGTGQGSTEALTEAVDSLESFDSNLLTAGGKGACLDGVIFFESGNPGKHEILQKNGKREEEVMLKIPKDSTGTKFSIRKRPYLHLPQRHSKNTVSENIELNPDSPLKSPKLSVVQCKQRRGFFTDTPNYSEHYDLRVVEDRGSESASMTLSKSSRPNLTGKCNEAPNDDVGMEVLEDNSCSRGKCDVQPFKMNEKSDSKPLAFRCMVEEKVVDFHEDMGAHLGGVIETSLVHDWGLQRASEGRSSKFKKESYSLHAEENGYVEVCDVDSEVDKPHDPIDIWSVIDSEFAEPVTVICSTPSSVETFTMRFPGNVTSEDDVAEEFTKDIRAPEEETLPLEKRLQRVSSEPLVVNCSYDDSEIVGSPGARCPYKEASSKGNLTLSGSGSVEASKQVVSVASVSETADELLTSQLPEIFGSLFKGSDVFVDSCPKQPRFTETNTILGRSNKCLKPAASQSTKPSNEEIAVQSKKSGVSNNQAPPRQIDNESLGTSLKRVNCPFKDLHVKSSGLIKAVDNSTSQTAGDRWDEVKVKFATERQPSRKQRQDAKGRKEMKSKNRLGKLVSIAQRKGKEEVDTENCQDQSTCSARSQGDYTAHRNDLASQRTVDCISNLHCHKEGQRKEKQTENSMERLPPKHAQNSRIHAANVDETVDLIHVGNACVTLVHKVRIEAKNTAEEGRKKPVTSVSTPIKKRRNKVFVKEKREPRSGLNCSSGHPHVKKEGLPVNLEDEIRSSKNESPKAKVVIGQELVTPNLMQQEASPKNPIANDLKISPVTDNKQLTSTIDTARRCGFSSPKTGSGDGSQTLPRGEKGTSHPVEARDIGLKSAERNAFTARHLKQDNITKPTELLNSTLSRLNFSKKFKVNVQLDTNKDCCSYRKCDEDSRGRIESSGGIKDVERDIYAHNKTFSGKNKNAPELVKPSKQGKSNPTLPLSYTGGCQDLESKAHDKVFVPIFSEDNRLIGHYTERSHCDHNRALDKNDAHMNRADHAYPYPRWVPPIQPVHSSFQNREIKVQPQLMPNAWNQYPRRGFTNPTRFQSVYPRFPNYGRPVFVRGLYQVHPLLSPAPTLPGLWPSSENAFQVRNKPIRPR